MYIDRYELNDKRACIALASTLHDLRVLNDEEFDQLIYDIYELYGDDNYVGDAGFYNDTI